MTPSTAFETPATAAFQVQPAAPESPFVDRRSYDPGVGLPGRERRQFTNSHEELSADARELAQAIDQYKLSHRRRFITYEEMLGVVKSLGYRK